MKHTPAPAHALPAEQPTALAAALSTALATLLALSAITLSGCGKKIDQEPLHLDAGPTNRPPALTDNCGSGQLTYWDFVQPQPTESGSVDLLFVVDTSASLDNKRSRLATTIPDFVKGLSPGTDYRMGVMLAHGGASAYSGSLYSAPGVPRVLNSKLHSPSQVQAYLTKDLKSPPSDIDEANGEMGLYSLSRSFEAGSVAGLKAQGFYRDDAALSVVFISDENDICYRPELHGYTKFPDFVPSAQNSEVTAYKRYCLNSDGSEAITPASVYARAQAMKPNQKLSLASIVHVDPARVPQGSGLEESIGHGILELVEQSGILGIGHVLMDVMDTSYRAGLEKLGNIVSTQLKLNTSFSLDTSPDNSNEGLTIRPETVSIQVDGVAVNRQYDPASKSVKIALPDAGKAGSLVRVAACKE
ncbi:MAG: hypothetical protein H7222_14340 [Methylotenera sp.]|nr:hypothetical protein [Oligoflexia bacterium]